MKDTPGSPRRPLSVWRRPLRHRSDPAEERQILRRIDDDWQIALMLAILALAALGGGMIAGHLGRRWAYVSASLISLVGGSFLVYQYVDHDGRKHLLFALFLLVGAACVFIGCFVARYLGPRIRWP